MIKNHLLLASLTGGFEGKEIGEIMQEQIEAVYTDPDFRRTPKTDLYCGICQRDIKTKNYREAFLIESGFVAVHPDQVLLISEEEQKKTEVWGWTPVGNDCAKRIGLDFTRHNQTTLTGE